MEPHKSPDWCSKLVMTLLPPLDPKRISKWLTFHRQFFPLSRDSHLRLSRWSMKYARLMNLTSIRFPIDLHLNLIHLEETCKWSAHFSWSQILSAVWTCLYLDPLRILQSVVHSSEVAHPRDYKSTGSSKSARASHLAPMSVSRIPSKSLIYVI